MSKSAIVPVDEEIRFSSDEIIVSKTDRTGRILYANSVFCRVAEMTTADVIGQPHSIIRHPDMPRCVFQLLWETISAGREIFAYVKNMSMSGRYYWVIAHVTPSFDTHGTIVGYHSNRRSVSRKAVEQISALYRELKAAEEGETDRKKGQATGRALLDKKLDAMGMTYGQFVWSLGDGNV